MDNSSIILNHVQIQQKIRRIACQIYEDNLEEKQLFIAGIANTGYVFAKKLLEQFRKDYSMEVTLLEIVLDKEDPLHVEVKGITKPADLKNKVVIVVDDVLHSGRTLLHSLRPFLEADVKKIRTVLLVDRDHKRYPVAADYVGLTLSTTFKEHIVADLKKGKNDAVYLT
ncbi:MAG: phosphoribosyltransferase [Bacteroidetes bacterium]|nr:phosphoribosyltransferase [Bacteroidota bacterium]